MTQTFKKIALGLAFSPRVESLLAECVRYKKEWEAELVLIHVGPHSTEEDERLDELLGKVGLTRKQIKMFWEAGKPDRRILEVCRREKVELLIVGALKKENLVQFYLGTIARKILRKATCSVLMLIDPSDQPRPFKNIVINAEGSPFVKEALEIGCEFGLQKKSKWLHIVRELKLYSLSMSVADQYTEEEYENLRQKLVKEEIEKAERMLDKIPHEGLRINVKLVSGKSGFELSKFAIKKKADLLIVGASPRRFSLFDRVFTHDLEYIFADLPCNLLMVNQRKGGSHG